MSDKEYKSDNPHNMELRKISGEIDINSKLVSFLYTLMRDHLTPGVIEELVRDAQCGDGDCFYTNGWLAKYADYLANKLK
jgi:hypothetical protein